MADDRDGDEQQDQPVYNPPTQPSKRSEPPSGEAAIRNSQRQAVSTGR